MQFRINERVINYHSASTKMVSTLNMI